MITLRNYRLVLYTEIMGRGKNHQYAAVESDAFAKVLGNRRGKMLSAAEKEQEVLAIQERSELYSIVDDKGVRTYYLYEEGFKHRVHGPAVEYPNGNKEWWVNGHLHREDGPAIEYADGGEIWYIHGKRHREGAPAKIDDGFEAWYQNGLLHREDGPAIIHPGGRKEWFLYGTKYYSEKEYLQRQQDDIEKAMNRLLKRSLNSKH